MRRFLFFLIFLLAVAGSARAEGKGLLLRLLEKAKVVGPDISLGDVADVIGPDRAVVDRLRRLDLGKAPSAGTTFKLTESFVKIALRREGYSPKDFVFDGAPLAEVVTQSQEVSTKSFLPAVKDFVLNAIGEAPENVRVSLGSDDRKITVPAGDLKTTFRPPLSGRYEGMLLLTAELSVNGHLAKVFPLRVQVDISHPVVMTVRAVEKGEKFSEGNLAVKRVSADKIPPDSLRRTEEALGRTAAIPLPAGIVLRLGAIYDPPVIKRGDLVSAVVDRGNVEITAQVRASEDGKPGEVIRVENVDTHKSLRGRVQDDKTVQVLDDNP